MVVAVASPFMAPLPPQPPDQWVGDQVHFQISGQLDHIEDPAGRRLFEGWASVEGLDYGSRNEESGEWEPEDVPSSSLERAIAHYVAKNNLFVWDHARHMPIGQILDYSVHPGVGVYVKGMIFRPEDLLGEGSESDPQPVLDLPQSSLDWLREVSRENKFYDIEKMLNMVWGLMLQGYVRGISWQGYTLKQWAWSPELNKHVKQHKLTLNITDFCITPIQVGQGAQLTRINKQAKALPLNEALRVAKALPLRPACSNTGGFAMSEQVKKVEQGLDSLLEVLHGLPDDINIDPETAARLEQTSKALALMANATAAPGQPASSPGGDQTLKSLQTQVSDLQTRIAQLQGEAAPVRNRVGHEPPNGPAQRPSGEPVNGAEIVQKALEIGGTIRDGKTNFGQGEFVSINENEINLDMYKLQNVLQQGYSYEHTQLGQAGRKLLQLAQQQHAVSLPGLIAQQATA